MGKNILIVDDEPNVRLSYRVALEVEGYLIKEGHCGAKALDELAGSVFDLAILDMRMPEMDGLDLLAELRQRGFTTPTVIITAFGDVPHAVRAMKLGAIDFLQKPITPESLRNVVSTVVSRHEVSEVTAGPRDDFQTHLLTAERLLNLRDFTNARQHLIRALELNDKSKEAFNLTGVLFEMQEDYDRAKKYYGHAIKLDKRWEPPQQNMRRIFELFNFGESKEPIVLGNTL
ncbi:MAG: response regulator [Chthoniobacterales bacterium]|nr:response regulator [Chthoniobacterales bacterium]